jgi:transglutaminase-like putative cysteine protease
MCPVRRARASKRHRQTRKWLVILPVLIGIAALAVGMYLLYPAQTTVSNAPNEPAGFKTFKEHYITLMKNLNSTETKTAIKAQLNPKYNQTDLFAWEHGKLTFLQDTAGWFEDPVQILNSGKGICVQWSIVYVSACLALNQPSRLVVAADTSNWNFIHVWAEDYFNGTWVHVDPSDGVWNNPSRYLSWDWGKALGSGVKIYAFDDSGFEEVTSNYMPH